MKPYNPLEKENLGRSVADSLIGSELVPLNELTEFSGAGVYAIYYTGDFEPYRPLSALVLSGSDPSHPIYVGKATPSGGRKGIIDPETSARGRKLYGRLEEHRKSLDAASNLNIEDFSCRYLVVDDVWIPLGEALMIGLYKPLWNVVVEGFGNHDPGAGRYKGKRPSWDVLHPGRSWALKCASPQKTEVEILKLIEDHWAGFKG